MTNMIRVAASGDTITVPINRCQMTATTIAAPKAVKPNVQPQEQDYECQPSGLRHNLAVMKPAAAPQHLAKTG